ncbi:hypothetical protein HETIRDRAFT_411245, partial [Heterobasidion irregulare TC 32-1]
MVVFITGASRGIGEETALQYARADALLVRTEDSGSSESLYSGGSAESAGVDIPRRCRPYAGHGTGRL